MIKRVVTILLVALALSPAALVSPSIKIAEIRDMDFWGAGQLEQRQGKRVIHLRGTPYEMGYQQGALLREEIRALLREYLYGQIIVDSGYSHLLLRDYARRHETHIPPYYREEMRGIADGAGVAYADILLLNTILDMLNAPRGSNFAVWGAATSDEKLLHGVNLDFSAVEILTRYSAVKFYYPENGHNFVSVSWAGFCGVLTALNDQGISLGVMSTPSKDSAENGVPIGFLLRDAVQHAADEDEVLTAIARAPRAAGYSVVVGSGKKDRAVAVEFSAHRYVMVEQAETEQGEDIKEYLVHTAYYLDEEMFARRGAVAPNDPSWAQYDRLEQLIRDNYGWLAPRKVMDFLHDRHEVTAQGVGSSHAVFNSNTLYSVVMHPTTGKLWIAINEKSAASAQPAADYTEFDLLHELGYR